MKSIRNLKLLMKAGFLAMALGLFAPHVKAQTIYTGKFTLPFEARWGSAVLPPGNYTISLGDSGQATKLLALRGEGKQALLVASVTDFNSEYSNNSKLILVDNGSGYAVRTLVAAEAGMKLTYAVPKAKNAKIGQTQEPKRMTSVLMAAN